SVILMDCGCTVDGYYADISRTAVFGTPTKRQKEVYRQVRLGQEAAMEAAQPGTMAGTVDDAVRALYESMGYGPGYDLPGLSHRTGHGIGLDIHEPVNLVHGETTILKPGMCFSNEPGIYIPGSFGVRIEDCFYISEDGPVYFTQPPNSLDAPFG
ncbi:MAG: peptidase, partial [Henriciella sp.]|nr:peptidase [Henriciella sp.]